MVAMDRLHYRPVHRASRWHIGPLKGIAMDCIHETPEDVTLHQSPLSPAPDNLAAHHRHSGSLPKWMAAAAVVIVAVDLRRGIVSIGPALASIRQEFGLSHTGASLLTAVPDLLMGALALPIPRLSRRFGRVQVLLTALVILCLATAGRAFANTQARTLTQTCIGCCKAISQFRNSLVPPPAPSPQYTKHRRIGTTRATCQEKVSRSIGEFTQI